MVHPHPTLQSRGFFDPVLERLLLRQQLCLSPVGVDWRVSRLQDFIDTEHGKLGWNLDRICEELDLGASGSHSARLFKKHLGVGIREYTKRKRLIAAAEQLKITSLSVREIAAGLGYKKQTDLCRQFKRLFSLNPSQFRTAHRHAAGQDTRRHDARSDKIPPRRSNLRPRAVRS